MAGTGEGQLGGFLGSPEGPLEAPQAALAPEERMRQWLTKVALVFLALLIVGDTLAITLGGPADLQLALTGFLGFFLGLVANAYAYYFPFGPG